MAKSQAKMTKAPSAWALGQPILATAIGGEGSLLDVSKALNWVYANRPEQHLGLTCERDGWDGSGISPGTLRCELSNSASQTYVDTDLWISADAARTTMLCSAECAVGGGDVVTVWFRFTGSLGTTTVSVTCSAAHNLTERTVTQAISAFTNGDEWVRLEVLGQVTTGTGSTHRLVELGVEEQAHATLPDPDND